MSARDDERIQERLDSIASQAEELYAFLMDSHPSQSAYYQAVATRARSNATFWRLHKALPVLQPSAVMQVAKAAQQFQRGLSLVSAARDAVSQSPHKRK